MLRGVEEGLAIQVAQGAVEDLEVGVEAVGRESTSH
jgi:hypothetical protein